MYEIVDSPGVLIGWYSCVRAGQSRVRGMPGTVCGRCKLSSIVIHECAHGSADGSVSLNPELQQPDGYLGATPMDVSCHPHAMGMWS